MFKRKVLKIRYSICEIIGKYDVLLLVKEYKYFVSEPSIIYFNSHWENIKKYFSKHKATAKSTFSVYFAVVLFEKINYL